MLEVDPGATVAEIAERHAVSTRTLQRLFRRHVGVGPKWVLRRYRLQEAAEQLAAGERSDWTRLALDLGYFDHAHFIRDFRAVVGRSPAEYEALCAALAAA
jgi:AraC-like DNA-binding protein